MRAVIFDLDGTLANTPGAIATITGDVLAERGVTPDGFAILSTVGRPLDENFAGFFDLPRYHPDVVSAVEEYRRRFGVHVRGAGPSLLYPGVAAGLAKLADSGLSLAIATSKIQVAGEQLVKLTGIAELFRVVAGHDTAERGKPHPDMALYVAEQLGLAPAECVVVGDSTADVEMGLAAGMTVFGVSYGVATAAQLEEAGAAAVYGSFDDLTAALLPGVLSTPTS